MEKYIFLQLFFLVSPLYGMETVDSVKEGMSASDIKKQIQDLSAHDQQKLFIKHFNIDTEWFDFSLPDWRVFFEMKFGVLPKELPIKKPETLDEYNRYLQKKLERNGIACYDVSQLHDPVQKNRSLKSLATRFGLSHD